MKITHVEDYIPLIKRTFPRIPENVILQVVNYGLRKFHTINGIGADVRLMWDTFSILCGYRFNRLHRQCVYNVRKTKMKLRSTYTHSLEKFNGLYYFGLSDEEWEKCKNTKTSHGYHFYNIKCYKIEDEVWIDKTKNHFFSIPWPVDVGWEFTKDSLLTKKFKYIAKRKNNKIISVNGKKGNCTKRAK